MTIKAFNRWTKRRALPFLLMILLLAGPALGLTPPQAVHAEVDVGGQGQGHDPNLTAPVDLPPGVGADWWAAAQEEIRQSEYHVTWQEQTYLADVDAAYQAPNRAHNLRAYFAPTGLRLVPRVFEGETPLWEWALTMVGYGYASPSAGSGQALQPVAGATLVASGNRIEYRRERLTEWYINDERGLEQGFTLLQAPLTAGEKAPGNEITLDLVLGGNLSPHLAADGSAIKFTTPGGLAVLNYGGLFVADAAGRQLPAHLSLESEARIRITFDATDALFPITVDPLATSPNWMAESDQADALFGMSVGTAGDVNGDGYSDVIVGAYSYDNGQTNEGRAYVYHGSATGLGATPDWTAESNQADADFGWSVGTAGDVNGDGYSDVIVGADSYDNGQTDEGQAFVYHGAATGLASGPDWTAESDQADAGFGISVGTAGDVNGDGYSDVIIGAYWYDNGQTDEGRAYVYYGAATGLVSSPDWTAEGDQAGAYFGASVGTAGDVNGDGYSDVIVGVPWYYNGEDNGRAYVYHGAATGLPSSPDWTAESDQFGALFGSSVGTAGDVNGDGYSDVIVGAYYYDNGQTNEGAAFIYHGAATGLGTTPTWTAESDQADANFGCSVGTAGDVNGDGFGDVIVGAYWYDNGQTNEGRAYVYYGAATGLPSGPDWTAESDQAYAYFGRSVGTAGDVNGDGYSDVIVGAPFYDNGQTNEGAAFLYYGDGDGGQTQVGFGQASTAVAEDAGSASLSVELSAAAVLTVTVDYYVSGGTATGGGVDYTLSPGSLILAPGQTTATITVTIIDDDEIEPDETVLVTLSNPQNASLGAQSSTTLTIENNDFDITPPDPPVLLSPPDGTTTSDDTPTLVWQPSPSADVSGYLLNSDGTVTDVGNNTGYTTTLLADGTYTWTVAAYDTVGNEGPYTDTWSLTVDTMPPDPLVLLSPPDGTTTSDDTPTLAWQPSPSTDVTGYLLNFDGTVTDIGNNTGYTTTLLVDGIYTWTVAAYDGAGNSSAYTDTWSFTVDGPPDPPTLLTPPDGSITGDITPTLTWQASPSPDVTGYLLSFDGTVTDVGNLTQYTIPTSLADGTYQWTAAAYDALGNNSPYTDSWSLTVDTTPPEPPILVSPADNTVTGDDTPTFVWEPSPSPDVAGYLLDLKGTITDVGNITQYTSSALANGVYTWTVAAYDGLAQVGPYTVTWLFTVDTSLRPWVTGVQPAANSHSAAVTTNLTVTLSEAVDQSSVTTRTLSVHGGFQGHLDGSFSFSDVVFDPALNLHPGELVDVSVTGGVQAGGQPVVPYVWQFQAAVGDGSGLFNDTGQSLASLWNNSVALGDLDGDGYLDAFVATRQTNKVWLNDGTGTFSSPPQSLGTAVSLDVALGDLDGDGDLDAFVANGDLNGAPNGNGNKVWLNDGTGTFTSTPQSLGIMVSWNVALGDLDGDGDLDAFVANGKTNDSTSANRVWLNDGSGTFTSTPQSLGTAFSLDVALGDLDGDGDLDAFVANGGLNKVWLNDGSGTFSSGWAQGPGPSSSGGVALGDLDGDGDLDAFVANYTGDGEANKVWLNDGAGTFTSTPQSLGTAVSHGVALGDLDGDGDLDAFVANSGANKVWQNDGAATFTATQGLGNASSNNLALGDLDGDGDLDAFVANWGWPLDPAHRIKVWRNQDTSLPPAGGSITPVPWVTITIPGGTFSETVVLHYVQRPITHTGSLKNVGFFYDLEATYLASGQPAELLPGKRYTITVTYDQADVPPGVNEADLALYHLDDSGGWKKEPTSVVDTVANTITATPDHFSLWGALESRYVLYLPLVVRSQVSFQGDFKAPLPGY